MLYKFKSRSTADLIMLEPNGRQILQIIGKDPDEPHGIVTIAQIPAAIAKLEVAVVEDDEKGNSPEANAAVAAKGDEEEEVTAGESVGLRQRAVPFLDMLRRSQAEGNDVVW